MTDQQTAQTTPVRKGGWPKGKSRKGYVPQTKKSAPFAGSDHEREVLEDANDLTSRARKRAGKADWRDESSDNLFTLSPRVMGWLADHNLVAQWNVETVMGAPIEQLMPTGDQRRFWEPVQEGEIPGLHGVERGGCKLYIRDSRVHAKAENHRQHSAKQGLEQHEARLRSGDIPNVTLDARAARGSNKVNRHFERIAVAGDD